jgi:hypothetical protein
MNDGPRIRVTIIRNNHDLQFNAAIIDANVTQRVTIAHRFTRILESRQDVRDADLVLAPRSGHPELHRSIEYTLNDRYRQGPRTRHQSLRSETLPPETDNLMSGS